MGTAKRLLRSTVKRIPGARLYWTWTDPLHIARRILNQTMIDRAHHATGRLLDVGCGFQPYRVIFGHVERYIGVDFPGAGRIDVFADALALPFRDCAFDTLLCNEVLEHVPDPMRLISESVRVLKPDGVLILTTPQTWGLHHEPYDYYRFTKYGLQYLVEKQGFAVIEIGPTCGMWATLTQRFADTIVHTYLVGARRGVIVCAGFALAPVLITGYLLDQLFGKRGDTLDNVVVARKLGGTAQHSISSNETG